MKTKLFTALCVLIVSYSASAQNGLISMRSTFDVDTTAERLESKLSEKGMTIFTRIEHSESADQVGISLNPTRLILFGNPKVGSPLMACQQSVAIDLPQKALITQDAKGHVWLTYNDPDYLRQRHNVTGCEEVLAKISKALNMFATYATQQ